MTRLALSRPVGLTVALTASLVGLAAPHLCAQQEQPDSADSAAAVSLIQAGAQPMAGGYPSREKQERAIVLLHEAVTRARHGRARTPEAVALYSISYLYRTMGVSDSAIHYGEQLVRVARSHGIRVAEAMGLFALAQVYADMERIDSLAPLAFQATAICQETGGCWFESQLFALVAPWMYRGPGDLSVFRALVLKAQARGDTAGLARIYDALGAIFTESLQQYDSALVYHRRVLQLKKTEQATLYGLGRAFRGLGMVDSAWFNFALLLAGARQLGDLRSEAYALANLGGICHRDMKPRQLGCALAYYDSAASVASQVVRQAGRDMDRVAYSEQASQLYSEWALAWLSAGDTIGKHVASLAALAVTEVGRSAALRDLMGHSQTRERIPPLHSLAAAWGLQLVSMLPPGAATLSYLIQPDTVLAWLILPTREVRVYRWAISYDSLGAKVSALRSSLGADDAIAGARLRGAARGPQGLHRPDAKRIAIVARQLASVLIPKDLRDVLPPGTDLILVPQNVLNLIPFAILPIAGDTVLGERYAIRYAPSLDALIKVQGAQAAARREGRSGHTALVVSDPTMPVAEVAPGVRMRLSNLPAADSEGAWVAARLGASQISGSKATESAVVREMRHADIIHFATHAFAYSYTSKARDSFLALAPDSTNDGLLTVGEVMDDSNFSVPAELVVLSACQTALGSVTQAEGTVGLQRAFFAKGARALLVSLWSVDDEATAMLMKAFYNHWLGDRDAPTKAEALRRAQRTVRRTPRFASPVYWAAFELVGAN